MKKILFVLFVASACFGGFVQNNISTPGLGIVNTKQVRAMLDDTYVTLRGYIVIQLSHEKFIFEDNSGSIKVEIDDDIQNITDFGKDILVEITGKVDKEYFGTEIEVKSIKRIK